MKVYIYTIPKAGTYFLAELVSRLGFDNSGLHVSKNSYLNTRDFDIDTNARHPSKTKIKQNFIATLRQLSDEAIAFGHFPAPFMTPAFPGYHFICAYRHPRQTLISEFIDFRFRRGDVNWISRATIKDDQTAFETYLDRHGPTHANIFREMISVCALFAEPFTGLRRPDQITFVNFEIVLKDPGETVRMSIALDKPVNREMAAALLADVLATETKTKATSLSVDREAFWTPQALKQYRRLGFDEIVERGRKMGWTL